MKEQNGAENSKQKDTTKKLTSKRQKLFDILCNPEHATKSITEICIIAEISRGSYYKSIKNEQFVTHLDAEKEKLLKSAINPILKTFIKEAIAGSHSHGLTLFKMSGDFVEVTKQQIEQQVTTEMKIIMEQEIRAKVEIELTGKGGGPIEIRSPRERIAARLKKLTGEDEAKDKEE